MTSSETVTLGLTVAANPMEGCLMCGGTGTINLQHPMKPLGVIMGQAPCPLCETVDRCQRLEFAEAEAMALVLNHEGRIETLEADLLRLMRAASAVHRRIVYPDNEQTGMEKGELEENDLACHHLCEELWNKYFEGRNHET